MTSLLLTPYDQLSSSNVLDWSPEIVVAGTRFTTEAGHFLINGIKVGKTTWHERLRGAQELQRVVSEIFDLYADGQSN